MFKKKITEKALKKLLEKMFTEQKKGKGLSLDDAEGMTSDWFSGIGGDTSPKKGIFSGILDTVGKLASERIGQSRMGGIFDLEDSGDDNVGDEDNTSPDDDSFFADRLKYKGGNEMPTMTNTATGKPPEKASALGNILSGAGDIAWGALSMTKGGERLNAYLGDKKQQDFENKMAVGRDIMAADPVLGREFYVKHVLPMVQADKNLIENTKNSQAWGRGGMGAIPQGFVPTGAKVSPTGITTEYGPAREDWMGKFFSQGRADANAPEMEGITLTASGEPSIRFNPSGTKAEKDEQNKLQRATGLRKEFMQTPVYKNYQMIQQSERAMNEAYQTSVSGDTKSRVASDQALAVLFQKMLDPQSVVRESEYARTPEGVSVLNYVSSILPQLAAGGMKITDEDRKALYDMAKQLLKVSKISMNDLISQYAELANLNKIDPKMVLGNIKPFDMGEPNSVNNDPLGLGL